MAVLTFEIEIFVADITILEWLEYNSKCSAPNPIRQEFNLSKGIFADWQVKFRFLASLVSFGRENVCESFDSKENFTRKRVWEAARSQVAHST